jgi:hypothetical protein
MEKYGAYLALLLLSASVVISCRTEKEYSIVSYDVHLDLQRDGTYHVRERIRFDFQADSFSSAHRTIPLDDIADIREVRVNSSETPIDSIVTHREDNTLQIRWYYRERSQPATFTIDYSVSGALYEEDQRNIVDWNAVGSDWSVPIDTVRAAVVLPGSFAGTRDSLDLQSEDEGTILRVGSHWLVTFRHEQHPAQTAYRTIVSFPKQMEGQPRDRTAARKVIAEFGTGGGGGEAS